MENNRGTHFEMMNLNDVSIQDNDSGVTECDELTMDENWDHVSYYFEAKIYI